MKIIQKSIYVFMIACLLIVAGCSSDDNKDADPTDPGSLTEEEVHQIEIMLVEIIRDSGRDFPQFDQNRQTSTSNRNGLDDFLDGPNNYIETTNEPGELKLRLWVDDEGNIIPSPTWQQNNANYCSNDGRDMRSAHKLLEFKVMYDPELGLTHPDQFAYGAQLNLIDIETYRINQSVWADPVIDEDNNWINATLNEAWNQMLERATIQGAVGPCEGEVNLSLHFTSEFKSELFDPEGGWADYDKVEGVVSLSFNPDKNAFEGSGSIVSVDGWSTGVTGDPIYTPYNGELKIFDLITPLLAEGGIEFPFMAMTMTVAGTGSSTGYPLVWLLCHGYPNGDYGSEDAGYFAVLIDEWDEVNDPAVILRKTYTLTNFPMPYNEDSEHDVFITEHTVIEIRRD